MVGRPPRSAPFSCKAGTLASVMLRGAPLLAMLLTLSGCANPARKAYRVALADARNDPSLCQTANFGPIGIYQPLIAQAWQKAHSTDGANAQNNSQPARETPTVTVSDLSSAPEVYIPPYSQRACHMTASVPGQPAESGFLSVVYYTHDGHVSSSLARWDSDTSISKYYDALKEKLRNGVDMNNPTLKSCLKHYPAIDHKTLDPSMQEAAVSLRAMLVRRCMANHAALQDLYQDMYFIHR